MNKENISYIERHNEDQSDVFSRMSEWTQLPSLPPCDRCHRLKIRCDNKRPKCFSCENSGGECLVLNLTGHAEVTREYIHQLESRRDALTKAAAGNETVSMNSDEHLTSQINGIENAPGSTERIPNFVEGSGLSFMRSLFTDIEWRENNADLLQTLAKNIQLAETTNQPNELPSKADARFLVDRYLAGSHVQNPFILREDVQLLHERIYSPHIPRSSLNSHDLFRIYMILAIGSVIPHRHGTHEAHPVGYYLAAMQYFDDGFMSQGIQAVQDLLLVGRFGIYHHIGTSVWDITQLCIRICIEQELHRGSEYNSNLLQEQLRRRVFWECYVIDRYSSITLDRPFAIAERDIKVELPADADDDQIKAAQGMFNNLDSFRATLVSVATNEMSVFFQGIRLRQITSQIHTQFSQSTLAGAKSDDNTFLETGRCYSVLSHLLQKLEDWRAASPIVVEPNCLYERPEWWDLVYARERLILIRKVVDRVPKRNGLPPNDLLKLCLDAASRVIRQYSDLFQLKRITYTRSYFQMLFTAGLSVMFYISTLSDSEQHSIQQILGTLVICEETLRIMGSKLPDARHYAVVFEALHRHVSGKFSARNIRPLSAIHGISIEDTISPSAPDVQYQKPRQDSGQFLQSEYNQQQLQPFNGIVRPQPSNRSSEPPRIAEQEHLYHFDPSGTTSAQDNNISMQTAHHGPRMEDTLQWAFLNDDTLWNMEAGLGEYAYGDPAANLNLFDGLDFNNLGNSDF